MDSDVEAVLAGPRGRRLALEYALAIADERRSAGTGVPDLRMVRLSASPDDVAARLDEVPLVTLDARSCLEVADRVLCGAMSWQPPDGDDVLAATPVVRAALARIAAHVLASPEAVWWSEGLAREQHVLRWAGDPTPPGPVDAPAELERWKAHTIASEERALRDRPTDPEAAWSGEWWSTPPRTLTTSTRGLGDLGPIGLWLMEDNPGWERASSRAVSVPDGVRVYEIDGPAAWARLCRERPVDVTGEKRHDWYRTTGRAGTWVVPDWSAVAREYDAVHLTMTGYLQAAGTAIAVDETRASVIAGWAPDETFWLTDVLGDVLGALGDGAGSEEVSWVRGENGGIRR